jgi:hypothetical protein
MLQGGALRHQARRSSQIQALTADRGNAIPTGWVSGCCDGWAHQSSNHEQVLPIHPVRFVTHLSAGQDEGVAFWAGSPSPQPFPDGERDSRKMLDLASESINDLNLPTDG